MRKNWIDATYDSTFSGFNWGLLTNLKIWIRPGRKATDILKRLLNPEAHMKQTKLPKGKKKTVICTNLKWNKQVRTSYVYDECGVALCITQC